MFLQQAQMNWGAAAARTCQHRGPRILSEHIKSVARKRIRQLLQAHDTDTAGRRPSGNEIPDGRP
jgi:hypothetical protein